MSYIYHLKPDPFVGTSLVPLIQMDKNSDLFKNHARKYIGRESLMDEVIPSLNCKWNDVVQFSALDPQVIVDELKKIQPDLILVRPSYFKINIDDIIEKYEAVIFQSRGGKNKGDFGIADDEITLLTQSYRELREVPEQTIQYWIKAKKNNDKLLWFPFIQHILIKGVIETSRFEICQLKL